MPPALLFEDSRRLTGSNLYFREAGAVLETVGPILGEAVIDAWKHRVERLRVELGWPSGPIVARVHASGASLAFSAAVDQLFSATEGNEWAWAASLLSLSQIERVAEGRITGDASTAPRVDASALLHAPGHAAAWDDQSALKTLYAFSQGERQPALAALVDAAEQRGLTVLIDDDEFSIGSGSGARAWPISALPAIETVDWAALREIPIALVTGSNGKTTTVRLLAAMARAHGWHTAHSCTDGLFIDGVALKAGDYSGPAGARTVLRQAGAEAAVLETARGGILRRGIAPQRVRAAVVTNISDDHFGEYGIHSLDDLGAVKLAVARVVEADGLLVLNADDGVLVAHARTLGVPLGWFSLDDDHPVLSAHRALGGATCGVRAGRLRLSLAGKQHHLGAVAEMPLTFSARAIYNIANVAAAALTAAALGIAPPTIADVLARFGTEHTDNPGRLQHWLLGAITILLDYAHNPEGLRGLLDVATAARGQGRIALVLGQAGNRGDAEIRELAAVAAEFKPAYVVLKDLATMLRGRVAGEVPTILRAALESNGIAPSAIVECLDETAAARAALAWAQPGDVVVLPIHGAKARRDIVDMLDILARG